MACHVTNKVPGHVTGNTSAIGAGGRNKRRQRMDDDETPRPLFGRVILSWISPILIAVVSYASPLLLAYCS